MTAIFPGDKYKAKAREGFAVVISSLLFLLSGHHVIDQILCKCLTAIPGFVIRTLVNKGSSGTIEP